ncbi:MAG: hypothetical protein GEU94_03055 [Micromonosporaceae bacterium]|nr:hypothetical protein [Micromonosporaceae bacterium]
MDPFHQRLAQVGLRAVARYGFCLAGGYAVQAHGFVERRSEDVDLFTTADAEKDFPAAVQALVDELRGDGLDVNIAREGPTFARLAVTEPTNGATARVELGVDWRAYPPTMLEIGPVLHSDDAVANKACALFGRGEVRDYIDVDGILRSGRYGIPQLLQLAADHDPGFDAQMFAEALLAVRRFAPAAFEPYGLSTADVAALTERVTGYAQQVSASSA